MNVREGSRLDVWEVNRLWMYGRETDCGCTGREQAVDVRRGTTHR